MSWPTPTIEQKATLSDTKASAEFDFTNAGDKAVTITEVRSSCGCTTAAPDKKTYAPGESGVIKASFTFGDRTGMQVKRIFVKTDDPDHPQYTLTLRVEIPSLMTVSNKLIMWDSPQDMTPKTVTLTPWRPGDENRMPAGFLSPRIMRIEVSPPLVEIHLDPPAVMPSDVTTQPPGQDPQDASHAEGEDPTGSASATTQPTASEATGDRVVPEHYVLTVTPKAEWVKEPFVLIKIYTDVPADNPRRIQLLARRTDLSRRPFPTTAPSTPLPAAPAADPSDQGVPGDESESKPHHKVMGR